MTEGSNVATEQQLLKELVVENSKLYDSFIAENQALDLAYRKGEVFGFIKERTSNGTGTTEAGDNSGEAGAAKPDIAGTAD